jgi:hypothetical protein
MWYKQRIIEKVSAAAMAIQRLTRERRERFLELFAATGNVTRSAERIGATARGLYLLRRRDDAFREAWEEAEEIAADRLEEEARRRAIEGVEEPVVSGGQLVLDAAGRPITVRRYSDPLLLALMKAHRPEKFHAKGQGGGRRPQPDYRAILIDKLKQMAAARAAKLGGTPPGMPQPAPRRPKTAG